jgi:hypothetical protein
MLNLIVSHIRGHEFRLRWEWGVSDQEEGVKIGHVFRLDLGLILK